MSITRSELARRADVKPSAVRYYEDEGVLPRPRRTAAGYRVYGEDDVERLQFIKRAQALGFTLEEISALLALEVADVAACDAVRSRAVEHLADVEVKIHDLERVRGALRDLITSCRASRPTGACPILDALRHDDQLKTSP